MILPRVAWVVPVVSGGLLLLVWCARPAVAADQDQQTLANALKEARAPRQSGAWDEALHIYKQADKETPDASGLSKATLLNEVAWVYDIPLGQYAEAEPYYERSRKLYEQLYEQAEGADRVKKGGWVGVTLNNEANLCYRMGRYARAEELFRQSLKLSADLGKSDGPFAVRTMTQLCTVYTATGRYEEAESLLQKALGLCADGSADRAPVLNELGVLAVNRGLAAGGAARETFFRAAEASFRQDREVQAATAPGSVGEALCLNNLGWLYQAWGRDDEAETALEQGRTILVQKLGENHPQVARAETNLGWLEFRRGKPGDEDLAAQHLRKSLEIRERLFAKDSPDHPELALGRLNLALLDAREERWDGARREMDQARRSLARYWRHELPFLPEPEQLKFARPDREDVARALEVGASSGGAAAEASAAWLLNAKAVAVETSALRDVLARDRDKTDVAELGGIRTRLANLTLRIPPADQLDAYRRQVSELKDRERDLVRALGTDVQALLADDPWVDLDTVRGAIPGDAVLVEIGKFDAGALRPAPGHGSEQVLHYGAWVVPARGQGEVRVVELGEAARIDEAVAAVRQAVAVAPKEIKRLRERTAEAQFRQVLQPLANLVLKPLEQQAGLDGKQRWIISPDGNLWLVPWEMLPLPENRYAVEDHLISYVVSGRDLDPGRVRLRRQVRPGRAVVIAHPDYDLAPAGAGRATNQERTRGVGDPLTVRGFRNAYFDELEGSRDEFDKVVPRLFKLTGEKPETYTDADATEKAFRALRSPRYLALSTHGFTLAPDPGGPALDPLYLCGLAFAGANRRNDVTDPDQDNGIVTGKKIVGTDLRGTELVVLSACDSGVGTVNDGEGVASLRQAFQLAGARNVVATLWEISDLETPELMDLFYANLARGGKAEALRAAQKARIEYHRKEYDGAHPFYWAAFTLTGEVE